MWCWNLVISENRPEIPRKFWNVALEKDGEDELDQSCEMWSIIKGQEEKEHKINRRETNWIGYIFRRNFLIKRVIDGKTEERKWRNDEEEDVSIYWMALREKTVPLYTEVPMHRPSVLGSSRKCWERGFKLGLWNFGLYHVAWATWIRSAHTRFYFW